MTTDVPASWATVSKSKPFVTNSVIVECLNVYADVVSGRPASFTAALSETVSAFLRTRISVDFPFLY